MPRTEAARTRELLGFDRARTHYGGKPKRWRDGVPSDGWMSDFRTKWMSEAELADLMEQLERWALAEKMATLPEMREECRTLHADGSKLETHATAPILKKNKKGEVIGVVNEWKKGRDGKRVPAITAPDAGFVPKPRRQCRPLREWVEHRHGDEQQGDRPCPSQRSLECLGERDVGSDGARGRAGARRAGGARASGAHDRRRLPLPRDEARPARRGHRGEHAPLKPRRPREHQAQGQRTQEEALPD